MGMQKIRPGDKANTSVTGVPKNIYPVRTEHARQFGLLHMQQIPRLVAGVLHCTHQFAYIEAVVAQEPLLV